MKSLIGVDCILFPSQKLEQVLLSSGILKFPPHPFLPNSMLFVGSFYAADKGSLKIIRSYVDILQITIEWVQGGRG